MRFISVFVLLALGAIGINSCVAHQPPTGSAEASPVSVTIGDKVIDSHPFEGGYFCIFPLDQPLEVSIHAEGLATAIVRPQLAGIPPSLVANHQSIHLTLLNTTPVTVEMNGDKSKVIHLFPFSPQKEPSAGPGVHYFGPGETTAGIIRLQAGDTLYLAPGAWVKGLVRSRFAPGVKILGAGVLDASDYVDRNAASFGNNQAIDLENSPNSQISGVTVFNSHNWTIHLLHSDNTQVNAVKILNPANKAGDDGIDLDSSSHIMVSRVFVRTNDDCIVIKNIMSVDMFDVHVEDSLLWNGPRGGNGLEIGHETGRQQIHDVFYSNIDMLHVEHGAALSIHNTGSSLVQNIFYRNIIVEDITNRLIDFSIFYSHYSPDYLTPVVTSNDSLIAAGHWDGAAPYLKSQQAVVASNRGEINNINVDNLRVLGAGSPPFSVISGFDQGHRVTKVRIQGSWGASHPMQRGGPSRIEEQFTSDVTIK